MELFQTFLLLLLCYFISTTKSSITNKSKELNNCWLIVGNNKIVDGKVLEKGNLYVVDQKYEIEPYYEFNNLIFYMDECHENIFVCSRNNKIKFSIKEEKTSNQDNDLFNHFCEI